MADEREWLRLGTVGVAALIGIPIPGDLISLALDRVFAHLDGARRARARELSTRAADALSSLARSEDEGAIESARLTTEGLLKRYGLSDKRFAGLALDPVQAADTVLAGRSFTSAELEILPLCRRLLICFYESLLSDPAAFAEILPHSHREQLRRLGSIESQLDALRADIRGNLAELKGAIGGDDQEFVQKLINRQVDIARRMIEAHRPHAAIELLQGILDVAKDRLDARLHFRILSNIGNAHLLLLDARQAGLLFLEAAKHASDDEDQAVAQQARGHLLLGELDAAERVASAGAERFPDSGRLQAIRLAVAHQRGQLGDPEGAVIHGFRENHHVAYTVAQIYASRDDMNRAAAWIKIAHRADPDSWQGRKSFAEILLRRASGLRVFGGTSEQQRDFQAAAAELERIWEVVRTGEHIEASAMIAAQVAMARWLARNSDGARQACDAGLAMGQRPHLLVQIAVRLAEEDRRPGDIITLLSRVDTRPMPELDIELASAQAEVGRDDDALRTLTRVAENSEAGPGLRAVARARSIEIRARRGNSFALLDEIVSLVAAEPDIVAYRVVAAGLYEELGEHGKALAQANAARELLDQQPTLDNQVSVANLLLDLDEAGL